MHQWTSLNAAVALLVATGTIQAADTKAVQFFESRIRPILANNCYSCHGPEKQKGGLRLDSAAAIKEGSVSGPVLVPGKPDKSLLLKAVRHEGPEMPPEKRLSSEEIRYLTEWVKMGAPWPDTVASAMTNSDIEAARKSYWAFQPLAAKPLPRVKDTAWPKNAIDYFVLAGLEAKQLKPVAPADRRTLIRRATYDLTGLPPTPEEMEAALADPSPQWFDKVVDRLLASPAYGERWGRHWLDLVRYADTAGDNSDYPIPQMYKYRNWVIESFNQDKPYDQFVREQLAGDLLAARNDADRRNKIIATGYLANARRFGSYEDARHPWHLTFEDTIDNLGRTYLGLTLSCCRCHDHKFDPLTTEDYYGLYGFFSSTRYAWAGTEHGQAPEDLIPLERFQEAERFEKERRQKLAALEAEVKRRLEEKTAAEQTLWQAQKQAKGDKSDEIAGMKQRVAECAKALATAKRTRNAFSKKPRPYETAYAVIDGKNEPHRATGHVGNARIHLKGDPLRPGKEVPRRFPSVLGGQTLPADVKGSGRLHLANWLIDHPLTARVIANRLWHYHFGKGIVKTPSDFGKQGRPPTHPELLDYLAHHLINRQSAESPAWSIKKMHRLIMLSQTYQLSCHSDTDNARIDTDNDLLWRFSRRRLDAEAIRDSILAVSGNLDRSMGGPHPFPAQSTWEFSQHDPFKAVYDTNRRSVYLMTQRIQRHPYLALFDGADTNASTAERITSTTSLQALYLMNNPFIHEQAGKLASRLTAERNSDDERIERAFLLLYGRPPTAQETSAAREHLAKVRGKLARQDEPEEQRSTAAWQSLARVLFMSSEFVYVN